MPTQAQEPRRPVGRQMLEMFATYDFAIEHRPGLQHGNADSLSIRPCGDCKYREQAEQKEHEQCNKLEASPTSVEVCVVQPALEGENTTSRNLGSKSH